MWGYAILQLLAVMLIAWAMVERREEPLSHIERVLLLLAGAAVLLGLIQLLPMPIRIWSVLPGRELVLRGYQLLGLESGEMPISLSPYDGISTLLALLPALGMLAATVVLKAYRPAWLAVALIAGAIAGVLLGILQVSSPTDQWYPYRISNFGTATGFFANSNHMASLLLCSIPFIVALGAGLREQSKDDRARTAALALAGGGLAIVIVGLLLNRSLAGLGLGIPVLLASALMMFGRTGGLVRGGVIAVGLAGVVTITLVWMSPIGTRLGPMGAESSISSRQEMLAGGVELIRDYGMAGTGLGTFTKLYPLTEDPGAVDRVYVNHVHNDYLELAIETGLPGILLVVTFLGWWMAAVWRMLRSTASDQFAFAGAIASAAILLHSLVDYPLRTAAMGAVLAMCLALILQSRRTARSDSDLRPVRHIVVG
jgi:O-antigen ligase